MKLRFTASILKTAAGKQTIDCHSRTTHHAPPLPSRGAFGAPAVEVPPSIFSTGRWLAVPGWSGDSLSIRSYMPVRLFHGDCRSVWPLSIMADRPPTVTIGDPPYSEHCHSHAVSCWAPKPGDKGARKRDFGFDPLSVDLRDYLAGVAALTQRWTVYYSDVQSSQTLAEACKAAGARHMRTVPWIRWSMAQLTSDRPPQGEEHTVWLHSKTRANWNGPGWLTHMRHKAMRGKGKHPTEKTLDQALDLVHWCSDPGDLVYDPTAGVATVGLACRLLGRHYVGVELDPEHYATGAKRLLTPVRELLERDRRGIRRWQHSVRARDAKAELIRKPRDVQHWRMIVAIHRDLEILERNMRDVPQT